MRFSIFDLFIGIVVSTLLALLAEFLLHRFAAIKQLILFLGFSLAVPSYLLITSLIYRKFHLRSLLLPRCPHCKDKNRHFWFEKPQFEWPRDVIICAICKTVVDLWYELPQDANVSTSRPSFQLKWPQSWGRWRAIGSGDSVKAHQDS